VTVLATIRPDDWNFALLLHVLGALVLVGALVLAVSAMFLAWRGGDAALVRLGFRSLLLGVLPAWVAMRAGGEWIASKEHLEDAKLTWLDIGFTTADLGLFLIVIATVLGGLAARRAARAGRPAALGRASAVVTLALLVAYLVAIWARTTKPT
jgi:uncharacterized membrane protein